MSEDKDESDKTEQPTAHRLEKAQEKGKFATSKEISHSAVLLALTLIISTVVPWIFPKISSHLVFFIENCYLSTTDQVNLKSLFWELIQTLFMSFLTPVFFIVIASLGAGFIQTGLKISFHSLEPKFSKLSPLNGFKRIYNLKAIVEFFKNISKIFIIVCVYFWLFYPELKKIISYQNLNLKGMLEIITHLLLLLFASTFFTILLIAGIDYGWQKYQFIKSMKMSKQEVKEEGKQLEGDPHIKGRLRQIRLERSRQRMMQRVPDATLIITNPTHYAIALKYNPETMIAPQLIAKGIEFSAQRIRQIAENNEIPLIENPTLARALYKNVEIDEEIPFEYYEVVAKIIRQLYERGKISL